MAYTRSTSAVEDLSRDMLASASRSSALKSGRQLLRQLREHYPFGWNRRPQPNHPINTTRLFASSAPMTATTAVKEQLQTLPKSLEPTSTSSSKTVTVAVSSSCSGRPTSAVTTRLRTSARTTVAASSSRAPSASLSPPPPSASSVSFTKCNKRKVGRRTQRFVEMDRGQFWMLKSGKTVEDILFAASLQENATVKIRSFTLDFNCSATKALFSADEWIELLEANSFDLPRLPKTTEDYLGTIRQKLLSGEHVSMVPLPTKEDTFSCELAMTTCMKWYAL